MTGLLLASLLLAAGVDPCAPVEPAASADAAAATVYREVGDDQKAAGMPEAAAVAYQKALALDPADEASRRALTELCGQRPAGDDPFQRGVALLDAGDNAGAVAALEAVRARGPDAAAALLEGIAELERGELATARTLLQEAASDPAHRDTANFYLGVIALRKGQASEAASLLEAAAANPGLAPVALDLARLARRDGKVLVSALVEAGWDSNASLAPGGTPLSTSSDGAGALTAGVLYRPHGDEGPYLRALGSYRKQARFNEIDLGGLSAAAGWQARFSRIGLLGEYQYDYRALGSASYLSEHRGLVAAWLSLESVTLGISWLGQAQSYLATTYQPFGGFYQRAEASARLLMEEGWLELGYRFATDSTNAQVYSWFEHGPRATFRWPLSRTARLGLDAAVGLRSYSVTDPALGLRRSDSYLDGAAFAEWDLTQAWSLRAALVGRRAWSNAAGYTYTSLAPTLALSWLGAP